MNTAELRRLAEAAMMVTCIIDRRGDMGAFKQACTPSAIIALLDRMEVAEKVCRAAAEMVKCQNGGYIEFHTYYGKALKATEKALQEWQKGVGGK